MTAGWGARVMRAAVFAAVCVLLAALGHVLMSGSAVPSWTLAAGFAATCGAGWALADRERGFALVVSVVVLAQGALHSAFSLVQSASAGQPGGVSRDALDMGASGAVGASGGGMAHMAGMDPSAPMGSTGSMGSMSSTDAMGSMGSMGSSDVMGSMGAMEPLGSTGLAHAAHAEHLGHLAHGAHGSSSLGMLAAHALAALLTGLWLAHGERAAFRLLRAVAGWLAAPLRLPLAVLPVPQHGPGLRPTRERAARVPRLTLTHTIVSRGPPVGTAVV